MEKVKLVTKGNYKLPPFDHKRKNPRFTVPDQSLSVREILSRYSRNVAVDVKNYQGVYVDSDEDLEKVNRMDFGDKKAYADHLKEESERTISALKEAQAEAAAAAAQKATHRNDADEREPATARTANGERGDSGKAATVA